MSIIPPEHTIATGFKRAFTLAEILITLTILGVVAVMAMPRAMEDISNRSFDDSAKVSQRIIEEAMAQLRANGELKGYSSNELFLSSFQKYLKLTKTCTASSLDECFVEKFYDGEGNEKLLSGFSTGQDLGQPAYNTSLVGFKMINGTSAILATDPNCEYFSQFSNQGASTSCLAVVFDTNGNKMPNIVGKDIRTINASFPIIIGGVEVDSADLSYSPISEGNYSSNNNYWAGARDACIAKGMRLPTRAELTSIFAEREKLPNGYSSEVYFSIEEKTANVAYGLHMGVGSNSEVFKNYTTVKARCVK